MLKMGGSSASSACFTAARRITGQQLYVTEEVRFSSLCMDGYAPVAQTKRGFACGFLGHIFFPLKSLVMH